VNPLTSLNAIFGIPILLVVTLRGEPGGAPDEPQHELMGRVTGDLLRLCGVEWEYFPAEETEVDACLRRCAERMSATSRPYALVMRGNSVAPQELKAKPRARDSVPALSGSFDWGGVRPTRAAVLKAVQSHVGRTDVVIATTGYTGRELYACEDRENQLYLVGSMGCASSVGLGVALARPERRVLVLDGDGAALMRLGALATLGYERPENLCHILLDNESHESTGAQSTVTHSVDLAQVAHACGYPRVLRARSTEELIAAIEGSKGELSFIHVKVALGTSANLPRPKVTPAAIAARFANLLDRPAAFGREVADP
jgi:phosphonopyruvate decarboxylase